MRYWQYLNTSKKYVTILLVEKMYLSRNCLFAHQAFKQVVTWSMPTGGKFISFGFKFFENLWCQCCTKLSTLYYLVKTRSHLRIQIVQSEIRSKGLRCTRVLKWLSLAKVTASWIHVIFVMNKPQNHYIFCCIQVTPCTLNCSSTLLVNKK